MANWNSRAGSVRLAKQLGGLNVAQYTADPDGNDKIAYDLLDLAANTVPASGVSIRDAAGTLRSMTNKEFHTTVPGVYNLSMAGIVSSAVVSAQTIQSRIIATCRRYFVPDTHVVVDINKPVFNGNEVHLLAGDPSGESFKVRLLHPDTLQDGAAATIGMTMNVNGILSSKYTKELTKSTNNRTYEITFTPLVKPSDFPAGQDTIVCTGEIELSFPSSPTHDYLSLLPRPFMIVLHKEWTPALAIYTKAAVMDDAAFQALYENVLFDIPTVAGTIRVLGNVGNIVTNDGLIYDGARVSFTQEDATYYNNTAAKIDYLIADDYAVSVSDSINVSPLPGTTPELSEAITYLLMTTNFEVDNATYNYVKVPLNTAGTVKLNCLPLGIDPLHIPVVSGFESLIPIQIYIEDTVNATPTPWLTPVKLSFEDPASGFMLMYDDPYDSTDAPLKKVRNIPSEGGNPIYTNTVYTFWVYIPDTGGAFDTLYIAGAPIWNMGTYNLASGDMTAFHADDPAYVTGSLSKRNSLWCALGNYVHLLYGYSHYKTLYSNTPGRATWLCATINDAYMASGEAEDCEWYLFTGWGNCNDIASCIGYLVGAANYMGCIDNWFEKSVANFDPAMLTVSSAAFLAATSDGHDLGLPFGQATKQFTGNHTFQVDESICMLASVAEMKSLTTSGLPIQDMGLSAQGHVCCCVNIDPDSGVYRTYDIGVMQASAGDYLSAIRLNNICGKSVYNWDSTIVIYQRIIINQWGNLEVLMEGWTEPFVVSYEGTASRILLDPASGYGPHNYVTFDPATPNELYIWSLQNGVPTLEGVYDANDKYVTSGVQTEMGCITFPSFDLAYVGDTINEAEVPYAEGPVVAVMLAIMSRGMPSLGSGMHGFGIDQDKMDALIAQNT